MGDMYENATAKYQEALEKFKAGGGEVVRKSKSDKEQRIKPSADQPKKPAGGAYGRFLAEKRAEISASLPAGHRMTDVTKKAGELFKALSEDEKKKYQDLYEKADAEYKQALEKFKAGGGEVVRGGKVANSQKESEGADAEKAGGARAAKEKSPKKRALEEQGLNLSEAILKKARDLGYENQIQNLAKRPDVVGSGKSPADLLAALVDAQGLVNPAKRALLGA